MRKFCKIQTDNQTYIFAKCTHKHTTQTVPATWIARGIHSTYIYNCIG